MRSFKVTLASVVILGFYTAAHADVYSDGTLTVDWSEQGTTFSGKFTLNGHDYPATAQRSDDTYRGAFTANGADFPFTATRHGDTLTLLSGTKTYTLQAKPQAPANPLDTGPAPVAATPADAPAGYAVVNHTDAGDAFTSAKPGLTTVHAALEAALDDLTPHFDARPSVTGAYEDNKDHRTGGLMFSANKTGRPQRGMISTKLTAAGADIAVLSGRADATATDWHKLAAPPADPAVAAVKLTEYRFPDGTGSIGLADGWKTTAATDLDRIFIQGPADQHVSIGASFSVITPDSPMMQTQHQMEERSRQMHFPMAPMPPMLVAPYCAPADAIKTLVPQLSGMYTHNGGPAIRLDKLISAQPIAPMTRGAQAAVLDYLITRTENGRSFQVHCNARWECSQIGPAMWSVYMIEMSSPTDTFDRDKPAMLAMLQSQNENGPVCQQIIAQRQAAANAALRQQGQNALAAQNAQFEAGQAAHRQQLAGYAAHNAQWAVDENAKSRSSDNFVEMIRGYRTVVDTRTGTQGSVDYNNVDGIVNGLNEGDPGRYVQVPYRDEKDPLIGR